MTSKSAVFLDRDGTLIENRGYINSVSDVNIYDFAFDAVSVFNNLGLPVIIVTNQSSVARGYATESDVLNIHTHIEEKFRKKGLIIKDFFYCPYHEQGSIEKYRIKSSLRKPEPGMLRLASEKFGYRLEESYMIGDNISDVRAGLNCSAKSILVRTGHGSEFESEVSFTYPDVKIYNTLLDAALYIKSCEL